MSKPCRTALWNGRRNPNLPDGQTKLGRIKTTLYSLSNRTFCSAFSAILPDKLGSLPEPDRTLRPSSISAEEPAATPNTSKTIGLLWSVDHKYKGASPLSASHTTCRLCQGGKRLCTQAVLYPTIPPHHDHPTTGRTGAPRINASARRPEDWPVADSASTAE